MILVFAGAGASKAVNPDQYPTTVEFFDRLPSVVTEQELFKRSVEYLKTRKKVNPIDIEQILWLVAELSEFINKAGDSSTIPGWFIEGNRLSSAVGSNEQIHHLRNLAAQAKVRIETFASAVNAQVYDLYGEAPGEKELQDNWITLFNELVAHGDPTEIVTTNYDVVIEEALSLTRAPIETGRTGGTRPLLQQSLWDITTPPPTLSAYTGLLTKLHGSVDWIRGQNNRIHVGTPLFQGQHEKHAIIYPGFKGEPTDSVFQLLHQYFRIKASEADAIIFIGYAFRDEYINRILTDQVRDAAQIVIINPQQRLPTVPFDKNRFIHIRGGFDRSSILEALQHLKSAT